MISDQWIKNTLKLIYALEITGVNGEAQTLDNRNHNQKFNLNFFIINQIVINNLSN